MTDGSKKIKRRTLYFDVLWVISIFFLIFAFTDGVYAWLDYDVASFPYYVSLFGALFARFPLWLCLMISGAILLDMHESIRIVWGRRILRVVIILVLFSLIYYISNIAQGTEEEGFSIMKFCRDIYSREIITQFWYLYAYIGFLVCLPFLRPMVKNMRNCDFVYLIMAVFVLSSILPLINTLVHTDRYDLNPSMKLNWIMEVIFIYPVMGYYFHHRMSIRSCRKIAPILLAVDLIWMIFTSHVLANSGVSSGDYYMYPAYHSNVTMLHCVTLFVGAKALFDRPEKKAWERVFGSLGGCSLGIYLLSPVFLSGKVDWITDWHQDIMGDANRLGRMGKALIWSLIVYFVCLIPIWLIRRIPAARKLTL